MTELAYRRIGTGPHPLVLLHGLLGSARNLSALAKGLSDRDASLAVIALDLTGHGASPPLPPDADSATLARDVVDTVGALGLPAPVHFVGHSLGGRVALRATMLMPASVASVTLLDIAPGPFASGDGVAAVVDVLLRAPDLVASRAEARAFLLASGLAPYLADWLVLNLESAGDGYRWKVDRRALATLHARVSAEDLWPAVEGPRTYSVRCIRADGSAYVSDDEVLRLEAAGCPVVTIVGASHFLHAERPDAVAEAILASLA